MENYKRLVCEHYKNAVIALEKAEAEKEKWRKELLLQDDGKFDRFGINITQVQPSPTINWQAVQEHYKIPNEALNQFLVPRKPQWRIAIKREIVTIQTLINEIWP